MRAASSPISALEGYEAGSGATTGSIGLVTKSTLVPVVNAPVTPVMEGALVIGVVGQDGTASTAIGLAVVPLPCVGAVMGGTAATTDVPFHTSRASGWMQAIISLTAVLSAFTNVTTIVSSEAGV
jgi:hypothetical protein